jgi:hypothetical protein
MRQQRNLPDYATCERCGEYAAATLRAVAGHVLCENCHDTYHARHRCAICVSVLPSELHHVASARQCPTLTLRVCLNCHRLLSERQYRWHPAWRTESHPLRCVVQGVCDVLALWLQRSPVAEQCRDLFAMLGHAALFVLMYLRLDALPDLRHLTDWNTR